MSKSSAVFPFRCSYRTAEGRQCRLLTTDSRSGLCTQHLAAKRDPADFAQILLANCEGFQTAQGINFTLATLYKLLAANRINARRASVLAFISSLLLRTLPAIDADRAAGVTDPTAKKASASHHDDHGQPALPDAGTLPGANGESLQHKEESSAQPSLESFHIERPTDAVLPPLAKPQLHNLWSALTPMPHATERDDGYAQP